jgi:indoleamine 2,3-dioxygenase
VTVENLDTLVDFTTLDDERWFVAIHVAIEAAAGPAIAACERAGRAVESDDRAALQASLETITESVNRQTGVMEQMLEGNDPEVFATEYRPYYAGFDGIRYEGVEELDGPQSFRGGSGAQSMILPAIDATLGIEHDDVGLLGHLDELRSYVPDDHRAVVDRFAAGPDVRSFVDTAGDPALRGAYNDCIDAVTTFRTVHFGQSIQYIKLMTGETAGTGGTDYEAFLEGMKSGTAAHRL